VLLYFMDRRMLEGHLAQAERHVLKGESHIDRQRQLVAELERDGDDITLATKLLLQFEQLQAMHIADRDRLRQELGAEGRLGTFFWPTSNLCAPSRVSGPGGTWIRLRAIGDGCELARWTEGGCILGFQKEGHLSDSLLGCDLMLAASYLPIFRYRVPSDSARRT
jgi:hypothetical protein